MAGGKTSGGDMGAVQNCGHGGSKSPGGGKQKPKAPEKKPRPLAFTVQVLNKGANVKGANVNAHGATMTTGGGGIAKFGKKAPGPYDVTISFAQDAEYTDLDAAKKVQHDSEANKPISVEKKNVLSALLEPEYKVVLFDRKMSDHQDASETKVETGVPYVKITFDQSNKAFAYDGDAKLTSSGGGAVDFFKDADCKDAFDGTIKNADIIAGLPLRYYLKSKTAGAFKLVVTPDAPGDAKKIKLKEPKFEIDMAVAEVKLEVYSVDAATLKGQKIDQDVQPVTNYYKELKKYELPDQIVLSDSDKIAKGRNLHVQDGGANGRAKILIKIDPGQWPGDAANYELLLDPVCVSGGLAFYDAEFKGKKFDKATPIKISELKKKNGERELWVEGSGAGDKKLHAKLGISLNRAPGGPAHTVKKNADWARFTVVKIEKVELDYAPVPTEAAAWEAGTGKFFINFKTDPEGRKIKIKAKLSEKIEGVPVHFMLAPDEKNGTVPTLGMFKSWGEKNYKTKSSPGAHEWDWSKLSAGVKEKDRSNRDDYLHLSKETDANGEVDMELVLSRIGGDKFTPGCYILEDAHLAKYLPDHSDLGKLKPKLAEKTIEVARKFWYEEVKVPGVVAPELTGAVDMYTKTKAEMKKATAVNVSQATVNAMSPQAIYPRYMVKVNGGNTDALVVSDSNKDQFFAGCLPETDKPVKVPILICDAQWDAGGACSEFSADEVDASRFPVSISLDKLMIKPSLEAGGAMVVSSSYDAAEWDPAADGGNGDWVNVRHGTFSDADFTIDPARTGLKQLKVSLPAGLNPVADTKVWVKFEINGAKGPYLGEYSSSTKKILAVYDPKEPVDFQNTIAHELGHAFSMVKSDYSDGLPSHEWQYIHQGSHCRYKDKKTCLMYQSGPIKDSLNCYCPDCHPYVLVQDLNVLA